MPSKSPEKPVVWIVDDSPLEAQLTRKELESQFAIRIFTDGPTMLEQIVVDPMPDVLVLDWLMPGLSGIEVCEFLRTREATSEQSILLLTQYNEVHQVVEGLAAGADDFLGKPYAPEELVARVRSLVRSRRLRERAHAAERSIRALLAHLPDGLIATNGSGEITFLNGEAEQILAASAVTVTGRHVGEFFPALANIQGRQLDGEHFEALPELELGTQVYAPAVQRMTMNGVATIAVTLRDVTEKRRLAQRRLDFYSMVAHDLRSPLAAMTLRVGQMKTEHHGPLAEKYRDDLQMVESRIADLVNLINDFLDIARSEGVGIALTHKRFDLAVLVRSYLTDVDLPARAKEVTIRFEAPRDPVETRADPTRIRQVIANLISNAVKFSQNGGQILVEVATRESDVEFAVTDAGRGIAEDKISELFKRYTRPSSGSALPGTGLGLMIVREIVAAHRGTCGVESTLGKGSRFWFRIPHAP